MPRHICHGTFATATAMLIDFNKYHLTWIKQRYRATFKQHRLFKWRRPFAQRKQTEQQVNITCFNLWSGLIVAIVSLLLVKSDVWELLEQQSYNQLHQASRALIGEPQWDSRVVVIAINEASVAQLGRFPWTRDRYAALLNRLHGAQPAVVAFDILFPESTQQDAQFAQAITENANVVLAVGTGSPTSYLNVSPSIADEAEGYFLRGNTANRPDADGISRYLPIYSQDNIPSFSSATLQVYKESMASTEQADTSFDRIANGLAQSVQTGIGTHHNRNVSLAETLWIKWPGEIETVTGEPTGDRQTHPQTRHLSPQLNSLKTYSYIDVINGSVDASLFQNKIVLIGTTLTGIDSLRTPFHQDPPISGVYLYAAAISNLLNQSFLRRLPHWQCLLLVIFLALSSSYLLPKQRIYRRLLVFVSFPLIWCAIALCAFMSGWWIPIAAPIATLLMSVLVIQLHEQQEKQQLMALFSMHVSPGTAELIWRHKGTVLHRGELAAQKLTATVLFMDIRGFASIAETLPSHQLLPWLNQYFETMTDCIMKYDGMVDKYIGDAIMAVFGAPAPRHQPEEIQADAIAALHAALEMHERLQQLNQQLAAQQLPLIKFGIGVHTGPLIGGTIGNRQRLSYSLFGDTVNIAARLESMTKQLPDDAPFRLLLSAETYQQTQEHFPVTLFQSGQLRGRTGHTDAYMITPIGQTSAVTASLVTASPVTASTVTALPVAERSVAERSVAERSVAERPAY